MFCDAAVPFKRRQTLNFFHLVQTLIAQRSSNHCSLDAANRHRWMGGGHRIYSVPLVPSCLCFQTEVLRGRAQCDGKSLPPLCQNEFSPQCRRTNPAFVCLAVSFVQTKLVAVLPSQRSSLFILTVSGRANKKGVFLFNIRQ